MEIVTLDILNAIINSMRYADFEKYKFIKKRTVVAHAFAEKYYEDRAYPIFMAALLKNIGDAGYCIDEVCAGNKVNYKSAEIIRTMPEIFPFQYIIADIVLESDEKIDGSGFPAGKEKVMKEAQIIGLTEDYIDNEDNLEILTKKIEQYEASILDNTKDFISKNGSQFSSDEYINEKFENITAKYNVYDDEIYGVEEEQFLNTIASLIDAKHQYTAGHTKRVATYSYEIAKIMGYSGEKLSEVRYSAYLHDIGKLGIDNKILDKPDKLSIFEYREIKNHARYSYEILEHSPKLKRFAIGALHHERIDGRGYPFGLAGNEIPEEAKIIAVADILDAITSDRPYRKPFTFAEAFDLLYTMVDKAIDEDIYHMARSAFGLE